MNLLGKILLGVCSATFAAGAIAQSTQPPAVTTTKGGTANYVPMFTASTNVENSVISQSGTTIGIGTVNPHSQLGVSGNITFGDGASSGTYGLYFVNPSGGSFLSATYGGNLVLSNLGGNILLSSNRVGIGTPNPGGLLDVTGNIGSGANISYFNMTDANSALHTVAVGANTSRAAIGTTTNNDFAIFTNNGTDNIRIQSSTGNVGIGTPAPARKLHIAGDVQIDGGIYFGSNQTVQSAPYSGSCGGDYAESMDVSGDRTKYAPGDLLVLDPDDPGKILRSIEPYSTAVAGIYSTKPGPMGRRQSGPKSDSEVPMAMVGVVPAKVTAENGAIKVGDLLVSSSMPGYAMKGTDRSRMLGAVVGKAMGNLVSGAGTIEVLVTLQ